MRQAALKQGYEISNQQIETYIHQMPEFQESNRFSSKRFRDILASSMLNISEFLNIIKVNLLIDQPKLGIALSSFALPEEVINSIQLVNQERSFVYLKLPLSYFQNQLAPITPKAIEDFYHKHANDFMKPEQVSIVYLQLSLEDLKKNIHPTVNELKNAYQDNLSLYTLPDQWKLNGILIPFQSKNDHTQAKQKALQAIQLFKQGEKSAVVAAKVNGKILNNGDYQSLDQFPSEWRKNIALLNQSGQITDPIYTKEGMVVLNNVNKRSSQIAPYEQVQAKVKENVIKQKAEEQFAEKREQLADLVYEQPDSLNHAAKILGLSLQKSSLFTQNDGADIAQYKIIRKAAFSNDVLHLKNNSDVININAGTAIVLRVNQHLPTSLKPLDEVSKSIEQTLKSNFANQAAYQLADQWKHKLAERENKQELIKQYPFKWEESSFVSRYAKGMEDSILDLAFKLPQSELKEKPVVGLLKTPDAYMLIILNEVKAGKIDDKQMTLFSEQLQNNNGLLEYELYKQSQINKANIEIHNT